MRTRSLGVMLLVLGPACGLQRVAGYVEELEDCSMSSSGTGSTESTGGSGSGEQSSSSGSSGETTAESSATTGTSSETGGVDESASGESTEGTGDPSPECGNGILEAFGAEPEECDDHNLVPDDGCGATCALDRRVFVTSALYNGAAVGGLKAADARCANLADDQGWPDGLTYRAWLSDSTSDARDRIKRGRGRLVMANGLVFAESWDALLMGQLENPLEVTEKSETYQGGVWTGTGPEGTAVPGSENCEDWTSSSALKNGTYGWSDVTTEEWTRNDQPDACPADFAIYCMQSL